MSSKQERKLKKYGSVNKSQIRIGNRLLYCAGYDGDTLALHKMLPHCSSPDLQNNIGYTGLIGASYSGSLECTQILLSYGANVDKVSNDGMSALMWASSKGHLDVMTYLINFDANVNLQDKVYGYSALHWAVQKNQPEAARFIMENTNIDASLKDKFGRTAAEMAWKLNL